MKYEDVLKLLKSKKNEKNRKGMAKFGINTDKALGISMKDLRAIAKDIEKDHDLALKLWDSGIHEARILASLVDDPKKVTAKQMDAWVKDFDSWDLCDQVCGNLFDKSVLAYRKAVQWSSKKHEFTKRAAFAIVAWLAVHDKYATAGSFQQFYDPMVEQATDDRTYVKKAISWAIRQLGKRNKELNEEMIALCKRIEETHPDSKPAKWIVKDAMAELTSKKVQDKIAE